ncbi:DNA-binding transcriptional ArsR family regulator [Salirhabdus euzebyi]|uniref:DNA-binding transcriptional ArsR family regulator n=1 Tax=Salirhabdus euzebyi TaxID=394506 RepID=A0A841Q6W5_9BACI|nr:metalloregulator ArsR/SmtB family transcription factor [Salirhabdus euzebyi]MBB6454151.1 DNA-binding transcriptional ArsR family regulator [Salirhabdus euzebyi]
MVKDLCDVTCINEEIVEKIKPQVQKQPVASIAQVFKALADETRLKIAYSLTLSDELCVCDVANIVGASNATTSHHLRQLRKNGLAKYRKQGKLAYYSLDDAHVKEMVTLAFIHYKEVTLRDGIQS